MPQLSVSSVPPHSKHRQITESQHGRGWQGPLWVTQPNPLPKQGHTEQAAQHRVQAGLEYLQRRRLHSLPGQPGPGLRHPQREEVLPRVQTEHSFEAMTSGRTGRPSGRPMRQICPCTCDSHVPPALTNRQAKNGRHTPSPSPSQPYLKTTLETLLAAHPWSLT